MKSTFYYLNQRGILLLTVLLIIMGISLSITLTIPREVRKIERMKEQSFIDSLVALESGVNNALKEAEFSELCTSPYNIGVYPTAWPTSPNGGRVLTGNTALNFLHNLQDRGMLIESIYNPPPVFNGSSSSWVVLVTEVSDPQDLTQYNSY